MRLVFFTLFALVVFGQGAYSCDYMREPVTCEWKYRTFKWDCPDGFVPRAKVFWGRDAGDATTCVDQVPAAYLQNLDCPSNDAAASSAFENYCNGRVVGGQCTIRAANRKLGGDPCRGTFKYMRACTYCAPKPCPCPRILAPVCGADGKTYDNACLAKCAGIQVAQPGKCPCKCPEIYTPICDKDGKPETFECMTECKYMQVVIRGKCPCFCVWIFKQVCGKDGITYPNACLATCNGVQVAHPGPCSCPCSMTNKPVCGKDGKTYANECVATCNGVQKQKDGEC